MRRQMQDGIVQHSKLHRFDARKWHRHDRRVVNDAREVVEQQRPDVELRRARNVLELKNGTELSRHRIQRDNTSRFVRRRRRDQRGVI